MQKTLTKDAIIKKQANLISKQQSIIDAYASVMSPEELAKKLHIE